MTGRVATLAAALNKEWKEFPETRRERREPTTLFNHLPSLPHYPPPTTSHSDFPPSRSIKQPPQRMSAYGSSHNIRSYPPGSGAEYMARQGWDTVGGGGGFGSRADSADGHISFYGKSSTKRYLAAAFICLGIILLIAVIIIILFATGMSPNGGGGTGNGNGGFVSPGPVIVNPLPPQPIVQPMASFPEADEGRVFNSSPSPIGVDVNENRIFSVTFFVEQQANSAYNNHASFAYQEAFRMINEAVIYVVTGSTLQQYSTLTTLESVQNSGDDMEIHFRIKMTMPSRSTIDATTVRNVLIADLPKLESRLNQITINPTRLTVTRK